MVPNALTAKPSQASWDSFNRAPSNFVVFDTSLPFWNGVPDSRADGQATTLPTPGNDPEVAVRRITHRMGMRFRLCRKNLGGRSVIEFSNPHLVIQPSWAARGQLG